MIHLDVCQLFIFEHNKYNDPLNAMSLQLNINRGPKTSIDPRPGRNTFHIDIGLCILFLYGIICQLYSDIEIMCMTFNVSQAYSHDVWPNV